MDDKNKWLQAEFEKRLQKIEQNSKKTAIKLSIMLWLGFFFAGRLVDFMRHSLSVNYFTRKLPGYLF